jgi:hypothetical protein
VLNDLSKEVGSKVTIGKFIRMQVGEGIEVPYYITVVLLETTIAFCVHIINRQLPCFVFGRLDAADGFVGCGWRCMDFIWR